MRWTELSTRLALLPTPSLCGLSQSVDAVGEGSCKLELMEIERVNEQPVSKPGDLVVALNSFEKVCSQPQFVFCVELHWDWMVHAV